MDFYVDARHGNDTNDGHTPQTAFATIGKINTVFLAPGTIVYFRAGCIWQTALCPVGGGDETGFVTFTRYGDGPDPLICPGGAEAAVLICNMSYVIIEHLEITNLSGDKGGKHCGVLLRYSGGAGGRFREIHLRQLYVHNVTTKFDRAAGGIIVWADRADTPVTFENLSIENCIIRDCGAQGITFSSAYNKRVGIDWTELEYAPSKNIRITGNYIARCGGDGIFQSCADNPLIAHNTVADCCFAGNTAYAGIWPHNSQNAVMQYNEAFSNRLVGGDGQGYDVDIDCTDTLVADNYSHHNEGGFLLLCTSGNIGGYNKGITVRGNISKDDSGQIFTLSGPIENILLEKNKIRVHDNRHTRLIGMYQWGEKGGGPDDVTIKDNDFYLDTDGKNQFYPDTHFRFVSNRYGGSYDYSGITDDTGRFDAPLSDDSKSPGQKKGEV